MIRGFRNSGSEDIFHGRRTKAASKLLPSSLWSVTARKLDQLDSVERLGDLRIPPGKRLEALVGDRRGQHSIRINDQFRVCFLWSEEGPCEVEVVDYH